MTAPRYITAQFSVASIREMGLANALLRGKITGKDIIKHRMSIEELKIAIGRSFQSKGPSSLSTNANNVDYPSAQLREDVSDPINDPNQLILLKFWACNFGNGVGGLHLDI